MFRTALYVRLSVEDNGKVDADSIENQELLDVTFSGQLDLRSSAIDVLKLISETIDIEFEQSGQLIRIKKRNLPS